MSGSQNSRLLTILIAAMLIVVFGACATPTDEPPTVNCELITEAARLACVIAETVCESVEDCNEELARQIECERIIDAQFRLCQAAQGLPVEDPEAIDQEI